MTWDELISNLEFGLWSAVILIPIIWFIQGESVSPDQFYMRCGLTMIAVIGAPTMTLIRRRRQHENQTPEPQ